LKSADFGEESAANFKGEFNVICSVSSIFCPPGLGGRVTRGRLGSLGFFSREVGERDRWRQLVTLLWLAKSTRKLRILHVPWSDSLRQVLISGACTRIDLVVLCLVSIDFLELPDTFLELHLLGKNPLPECACLLELLFFAVEEIL
jgi:hypothetical protein